MLIEVLLYQSQKVDLDNNIVGGLGAITFSNPTVVDAVS